jgi:hypothetical protein
MVQEFKLKANANTVTMEDFKLIFLKPFLRDDFISCHFQSRDLNPKEVRRHIKWVMSDLLRWLLDYKYMITLYFYFCPSFKEKWINYWLLAAIINFIVTK